MIKLNLCITTTWNPAGNHLFKVNNENTRTQEHSKLKIKTPGQHQWRRSGVFIVNFEQIFAHYSGVFTAAFEQVNAD